MPSYIHHISTSVPENHYDQQFVREFMKKHVAKDRMTSMILHRIYSQSGIGKRHSVLKEFHSDDIPAGSLFRDAETGAMRSPSTGERNALYTQEARKLFTDAAAKIFAERSDLSKQDVTHVITVSCTGFYAPGPDLDVVNALGLSPTTQRLHIGFMGCYAALPALRMAQSITKADSSAVVLIVAAELCTLHLKFESDTDALLSTTVFADGCAAALVSSQAPLPGKGALRLDGLYTSVTPNGAEDMAWTIGDNGFDMILSSYIPDIIESNLDGVLSPIWAQSGKEAANIDIWAVHPGGRAIVDKVQSNLGLQDEQVASSRKTLHDYGNMSSATILFVLKDVMQNLQGAAGKQVLAMAFGPGLTVETGLLCYTEADAASSAQQVASLESIPA